MGWLGLGLGTATARAGAEESFKEGIAAVDLERWREAAAHFRQAVAAEPQESERRIFISGAFSRPYLPHFYLGWALYQQGTEACEAALEAWQVSESQKVVVSFKRLHQDLVEGRTICRRALLPQTEAQIRRRLADAETLLLQLDASPEALRWRRTTEEALATARQRLQVSLAAQDLTAARRIGEEVEGHLRRLEAWLEGAAERASQEQESAHQAARQAMSEAEGFERRLLLLLADPELAEHRDRAPDPALAKDLQQRLDALRQRSSATSDETTQLEALRAGAEAIRDDLVALIQRYDEVLAEEVEEPSPSSARRSRASSAPSPSDDADTETPSSTGLQPPSDPLPAEGTRVAPRGLLESAEGLLQWVRETDSKGRLLDLQAERLRSLLRAAGSQALDDAAVARLEMSHGALQLLAAGQALARRDAQGCLRVLAMRPLGESSWRAQGHLFAAAAHFMLYERSGGQDREQLRAATRARDRCWQLRPGLAPDDVLFSPAFRAFFLPSAQNR